MKPVFATLLLAAAAAFGQYAEPVAGVEPAAVVAVLNGKSFTAAQIQQLVAVMPPQVQSAFKKDPKQFLRDHAWYMVLQDYATKQGLDKQSPLKESLEFSRLFLMSQAAFNHASSRAPVSPEEQRKHYEENKDKYREAKVRMIYVPFSDLATEGEAKAKAGKLAERAKAREDFAKLIKETGGSDQSFAVRLGSAQPPEAMRRDILARKKGEIAGPLRHENGYYVFSVDAIDVLPYEAVNQEIYKEIQEAKFRAWQAETKSQASVQFQNEVFFQNITKEK